MILFLAACAPFSTPLPPTETSVLPTYSPAAALTATDTATPLPSDTSTPMPPPTATSTRRPAIHSGNAGCLTRINQLQHPEVRSLAFSPDGRLLATADYETATI